MSSIGGGGGSRSWYSSFTGARLSRKEKSVAWAGLDADGRLPFPTALVLLHPEYEVLFLPCVASMAGKPIVDESGQQRPGLLPGTAHSGGWETNRGVKEWLSRHFPRGRSYKPTLDQLPMTRMLDLDVLRAADVPCFGTLERALAFLARAASEGATGVYPASGS